MQPIMEARRGGLEAPDVWGRSGVRPNGRSGKLERVFTHILTKTHFAHIPPEPQTGG